MLRKYFEHPAITTDVIVGFPGETEEEFEMTKAYLQRIRFYEMHIFQYSKREGTKRLLWSTGPGTSERKSAATFFSPIEKKDVGGIP